MRTLVTLALFALIATPVAAQTNVPSPTPTTVKLQLDVKPAADVVDFYRLYDLPTTGAAMLLMDKIPVAASGPTQFAFPALTPGVHNLTARAAVVPNLTGTVIESANSNVLAVRVFVTNAPTGLSIIVAEFIEGLGWQPTLKILPRQV